MSELTDLIVDRFNRFTDFEALKVGNESLIYADLLKQALEVSACLKSVGAVNETIGLVGQKTTATYISMLGILLAGCNYTPVKSNIDEYRLLDILDGAKINFFIGDQDNIEIFENNFNALNKKPTHAPIFIAVDPVSTDKICLPRNDIHQKTEATPLVGSLCSKDEDLAYILFTSGSTGEPKGVKVSHANLTAYISAISELWKMPAGFRMSQFHDLSFDPSISDIFFTFCNGGTLCVVPQNEMLLPNEFIIREKINIWSSVPSVGNFMLQMDCLEANSFSTLKIVRFAGEPLSETLAKAWQAAAPGASIENHYGPTEATIDVCRNVYCNEQQMRSFNNQIVPIGHAFPGTRVEILAEDNILIHQENIKGEIVFKGPQITKGYLNDQKKTNLNFVRFEWDDTNEIWYKSGDIGFRNSYGLLECVGRVDSQIKIMGRRVEIGAVEFVLRKFKLTENVVVVPLRDQRGHANSIIAFTLFDMTKADIIHLRKQSAELLDSVFFPKKFFTITEFPLAPSGKTDRKLLETMAKELVNKNDT